MPYLNETKLPAANEESSYLLDDKNSKFYHIFKFIKKAYGNDISKVIRSINSILFLGLSLKFIKNKKIRSTLKTIQIGIPAVIFGTEFYISLKNYIKEVKNEKNSIYQKQAFIYSNILGIDKNDKFYGKFTKYDFNLGTEVIFWLISKPNIPSIKILKFYEEDGKEIEKLNIENNISIGGKSLLILSQYENIKFLWVIRIKSFGTHLFIDTGTVLIKYNENETHNQQMIFTQLKRKIIRDFILILDCKKNILKFDGIGSIKAYPRITVMEKINQFDVNELLIEINNVLSLGRRRAYAFVGKQGVGKSSILRKIGELTTNHMIIYISPEDFNTIWKIQDKFELIKTLGKCIIIIEDLDGYDFEEKNERATTFLNEIDDVNDDLNAVIIVTINETNKVHKSIIDRPGRFDRVIEIKPPADKKEIYEILLSKFNKLKPIYCPESTFELPDFHEINEELIEKCIKNIFTQAEISNAIMEQIFLDCKKIIETNGQTWNDISVDFFNKKFDKAIDIHMETKRAITNADFSLKTETNNNKKEDECLSHPTISNYK